MGATKLGYLVAAYGPCPPKSHCSFDEEIDPMEFIEEKCIPCLTRYWEKRAEKLEELQEDVVPRVWVTYQSLN